MSAHRWKNPWFVYLPTLGGSISLGLWHGAGSEKVGQQWPVDDLTLGRVGLKEGALCSQIGALIGHTVQQKRHIIHAKGAGGRYSSNDSHLAKGSNQLVPSKFALQSLCVSVCVCVHKSTVQAESEREVCVHTWQGDGRREENAECMYCYVYLRCQGFIASEHPGVGVLVEAYKPRAHGIKRHAMALWRWRWCPIIIWRWLLLLLLLVLLLLLLLYLCWLVLLLL